MVIGKVARRGFACATDIEVTGGSARFQAAGTLHPFCGTRALPKEAPVDGSASMGRLASDVPAFSVAAGETVQGARKGAAMTQPNLIVGSNSETGDEPRPSRRGSE